MVQVTTKEKRQQNDKRYDMRCRQRVGEEELKNKIRRDCKHSEKFKKVTKK